MAGSRDRTDRVPLPVAEARCEPAHPGQARFICARWHAAVLQGSPMGDYSNRVHGCTPICDGFLSVQSAQAQAKPAMERKVKPAVKGIV